MPCPGFTLHAARLVYLCLLVCRLPPPLPQLPAAVAQFHPTRLAAVTSSATYLPYRGFPLRGFSCSWIHAAALPLPGCPRCCRAVAARAYCAPAPRRVRVYRLLLLFPLLLVTLRCLCRARTFFYLYFYLLRFVTFALRLHTRYGFWFFYLRSFGSAQLLLYVYRVFVHVHFYTRFGCYLFKLPSSGYPRCRFCSSCPVHGWFTFYSSFFALLSYTFLPFTAHFLPFCPFYPSFGFYFYILRLHVAQLRYGSCCFCRLVHLYPVLVVGYVHVVTTLRCTFTLFCCRWLVLPFYPRLHARVYGSFAPPCSFTFTFTFTHTPFYPVGSRFLIFGWFYRVRLPLLFTHHLYARWLPRYVYPFWFVCTHLRVAVAVTHGYILPFGSTCLPLRSFTLLQLPLCFVGSLRCGLPRRVAHLLLTPLVVTFAHVTHTFVYPVWFTLVLRYGYTLHTVTFTFCPVYPLHVYRTPVVLPRLRLRFTVYPVLPHLFVPAFAFALLRAGLVTFSWLFVHTHVFTRLRWFTFTVAFTAAFYPRCYTRIFARFTRLHFCYTHVTARVYVLHTVTRFGFLVTRLQLCSLVTPLPLRFTVHAPCLFTFGYPARTPRFTLPLLQFWFYLLRRLVLPHLTARTHLLPFVRLRSLFGWFTLRLHTPFAFTFLVLPHTPHGLVTARWLRLRSVLQLPFTAVWLVVTPPGYSFTFVTRVVYGCVLPPVTFTFTFCRTHTLRYLFVHCRTRGLLFLHAPFAVAFAFYRVAVLPALHGGLLLRTLRSVWLHTLVVYLAPLQVVGCGCLFYPVYLYPTHLLRLDVTRFAVGCYLLVLRFWFTFVGYVYPSYPVYIVTLLLLLVTVTLVLCLLRWLRARFTPQLQLHTLLLLL